jgi:hypothetical protein
MNQMEFFPSYPHKPILYHCRRLENLSAFIDFLGYLGEKWQRK